MVMKDYNYGFGSGDGGGALSSTNTGNNPNYNPLTGQFERGNPQGNQSGGGGGGGGLGKIGKWLGKVFGLGSKTMARKNEDFQNPGGGNQETVVPTPPPRPDNPNPSGFISFGEIPTPIGSGTTPPPKTDAPTDTDRLITVLENLFGGGGGVTFPQSSEPAIIPTSEPVSNIFPIVIIIGGVGIVGYYLYNKKGS